MLLGIAPKWRIYASVDYAGNGSDNGSSLVWCQGIICTNAELQLQLIETFKAD